jgi:hypothetical protein
LDTAFEALSYSGGDIQKGALLVSAAALMMMMMVMMMIMMMHFHSREPIPENEEEVTRMKANNPVALFNMGNKYYDKGDCEGAFEITQRPLLGEYDGFVGGGC